jgi:NAD(P)-dependent dehydrogenase (short-subunit alcohol dehydrogenase family)
MTDFQGLVAVVTGGASGIGAATALLLQGRGARVAVLDRSTEGAPDGVLALRCDVTDTPAVDATVTEVVERLGGLDVLVNNAGIGAVGDVSQNDDAEWARVLDVNVTAIARVTRAALPHLRRSPHAAVVNTCSAVAFIGVRQRALYGASKGAVLALTLAMAADHASEGIRVNAVAPGTADTPWVARLLEAADDPEAAAEALRRRQPLGRLVSAEEVAYGIASLASPLAGSTTGTILRIDGGMTSVRL